MDLQGVQQGEEQKCPHEVTQTSRRRAQEVQDRSGVCCIPAPPVETVPSDQYCSNNYHLLTQRLVHPRILAVVLKTISIVTNFKVYFYRRRYCVKYIFGKLLPHSLYSMQPDVFQRFYCISHALY